MRALIAAGVMLAALLAGGSASGQARVELLSMGIGEDLYARFGHTALRVRTGDTDLVYNFGYTRFEDSRLIWRFLRGEVVFWLEVSTFEETLANYIHADRSLYLQELQLSAAQHQQLAGLLRWNALPDNRRYVYHHFRDNCATRPRDLLDRVTGGWLRQQLVARPSGLRLRELVRQGFSDQLGLLVLSDVILGRLLDRPLSLWDAAFLPRVLMSAVAGLRRDGRSLAGPPHPVYLRQGGVLGGDAGAGERVLWLAALLLLALAAATAGLARQRWAGLLLLLQALPLGLLGLLVWGLAVITPLPELRWNENLILLWPTDLLLLVVGIRWLRGRLRAGRLLRAYAVLRLLVTLAAGLGQLTGLLYQRPLVFLIMSLALAAGLALACRRQPGASSIPAEAAL